MNTFTPVKNLLSDGKTNAKTIKNEIKTFILYLAPANVSGFNVCPFASKGCIEGCLNTAGLGIFSNVQNARINKTKFWALDRLSFYVQLTNEILKIHSKALKNNEEIAIRLNGTSDIDHLSLIKKHTGIDFLSDNYKNLFFYDYTKNPNHIKKYLNTNYKLTFSRSESNDLKVEEVLSLGGNVAVVFNSSNLPATYKGKEVINGDKTDLRYFDPKNVIVGLYAKGKAKKDLSGFVVNI